MQQQFGMTVLLTTHYMEEADALCDRVALMHHGALQTIGTPEELKATLAPEATLEDVFRHYSAAGLTEDTADIRQIRSSRRVDRHVG